VLYQILRNIWSKSRPHPVVPRSRSLLFTTHPTPLSCPKAVVWTAFKLLDIGVIIGWRWHLKLRLVEDRVFPALLSHTEFTLSFGNWIILRIVPSRSRNKEGPSHWIIRVSKLCRHPIFGLVFSCQTANVVLPYSGVSYVFSFESRPGSVSKASSWGFFYSLRKLRVVGSWRREVWALSQMMVVVLTFGGA
jgi:hypothetical protein